MPLVVFDKVCLEFGDQPLLVDADFAIDPGERVCLIGRNGTGKSSMMKLINGDIPPDRGEIHWQPDMVISRLEQTLPSEHELTVEAVVAGGLAELQGWIEDYERRAAAASSVAELRSLERLERRIASRGGWQIRQRVEAVCSELGLPMARRLSALSGGWQRRVGLARALVSKPDLLLLDEPTNHLDLASIRWLEDRVAGFDGSVMFVTHDRAFLQRLATRIIELDRGRVTSWPGDYDRYLREKERALDAEAAQNKELDKKLAKEETWVRQGMKARRKRNEGRVRALQAMRAERARRVDPQQGPKMQVEQAEQSGRKVIEARGVCHRFGDAPLIDNLSLKIMRGDRIGLVGNNGVGKTTLLRILLGEIEPESGSVKLGTGLEIGYFDQLRRALDPEKTVAEVVGDGRDHVTINGRDRHVIGYLKGFLFSPRRARSPVKSLSGGETNRLILARLFTRPTNLLVLDEPTNDLDVETLEVLEDQLVEYPGTLIVVSHDRRFLDNVITSVLVFEEGGRITEYVGGYSDWARKGRPLKERGRPGESSSGSSSRPPPEGGKRDRTPTKLSYKDKRELEQLPDRIEALEQEVAELQERAGDPALYTLPGAQSREVLDRLASRERALNEAVERWSELEALQQKLSKNNAMR